MISKPPIRPNLTLLEPLYRVADAAGVLAALYIGSGYAPDLQHTELLAAGGAAVAVYFLIAEISGMYRNWRGVTVEREVLCALLTWGYSLPILFALAFVADFDATFTRTSLIIWLINTPMLIAAYRIAIRGLLKILRSRGWNTRGFAVVGVNDLGIQLAHNIAESPETGLELVGFYDDRDETRTPDLPQRFGTRLGDIDELVEQARQGSVSMIYITFPMRAEDRIRNILSRLGDTTASVYIVPDFFVFELLHSRWTNIGGLPAVSVFDHPFYGVDGLVKRVWDIALSSLLLLVLAVPMLIISLLVKLSSPGPVLFRQKRYGLDGREILVCKFRSMRCCDNGPKVAQAQKNDPRVTRIGAILRKTSLDELPQLFNVLGGSMSLVGPRPHASAHNEEYRKLIPGYMLRHKVKPGITGLAQVNGWRGETETLDKMQGRIQCDHQYIREWSLWLDVKILLKTVLVVLSRQNAY